MRAAPSLLVPLVVAAAIAWTSMPAFGQPRQDPVTAEALFNAGKQLLADGDWKAACEKFEASMELDPAVGTLIKIARCREQEGRLAKAWYDYQRALQLNRQKTDQTERRRAELEEHIKAAVAALDPRVPKLAIVIRKPPAGLRVVRDGIELPTAALGESLPVDPGKREIVVEAPGYRTEKRTVEALEGKAAVVELQLVPDEPLESAGAVGAPPAALPVDRPSRHAPAQPDLSDPGTGRAQRIAGLVIGGAGVLTLGVAGYFATRTLSQVSDSSDHCEGTICDQTGVDLRDDARANQSIGFVLLGVGAAAVGAGIALYATSSSPRATGGSPAKAAVLVGPRGAVVAGSW